VTEWLLTADGCPYALGTAGCPTSLTSTDPSWSAAWVIQSGMLAWPEGTARFLLRPDGTCDAGPMTFRVHDHQASGGPYSTRTRLATYLFTRHHTRVPSAKLVTAIDAASTSFDVTYAAHYGLPGVLWIDGEAILCDAPTGNTVPIATRGYYGSRITDHVPHGAGTQVWGEFPFLSHRRVVLWEVDEQDVATPVWRGYLDSGAATRRDGSDYDLPCKHVITYANELDLGMSDASPTLIGYDLAAVRLMVKTESPAGVVDSFFSGTQAPGYYLTADSLCAALERSIRSALTVLGLPATPDIRVKHDRGELVFAAQFLPTNSKIGISIAGEETWIDGTTSSYVVRAGLPPTCLFIALSPGIGTPATLRVDSFTDLPSVWTTRTSDVDNAVCRVTPVLRAALNESTYLVFRVASTSSAVTPPSITAYGYLRTRPNAAPSDVTGITTTPNPVPRTGGPFAVYRPSISGVFITQPTPLSVVYELNATHWLYGVRCNLLNDTNGVTVSPSSAPEYLGTRLDARDWDFSNTSAILRHTAGTPNARTIYLDGRQKFGQLLYDWTAPSAVGLGITTAGRCRFVPIRPPLESDEVTAQLTGGDYATRGSVAENPEVQEQLEALVNKATVELPDATITANDFRSQRLYGLGKTTRIKVNGVESIAQLGSTPQAISAALMHRVIGLWAEPTQIIRFRLLYDKRTLRIGDIFELTDDQLIPDGAGERGVESGRFFVCGAPLPFDDGGVVIVDCWRWESFGGAGYAPAAHVQEISGADVKLSRSFLDSISTKNYDGSDPVTGDGGARWFKPGYKIRFMELDTSAWVSEGGYEVASFSGNVVTLTAPVNTSPINWQAKVVAGDWVDIIFDTYDVVTAEQKQFAYIGAPSGTMPEYVIAGTGDEAKRWSP